MHSLNLGVLAHVDAGKTSLTERLLFHTGASDAVGSVDSGTTRTDSMALERRRGITIRTAVASFEVDDVAVNLIDTPGHPDFIAEVERALGVLDAAILVVSAVEGVQSQTVALWRALERLGVPTLVFVNKTDRAGADPDRVAAEVRTRLRTPIAVLSGRTSDQVAEAVAEVDDAVLERWLANDARRAATNEALRRSVASCRIVPVVFGSALTGAGVPDLAAAIASLLPRAAGDAGGDPTGVVFKVDRDGSGRRVHVRMRSGTLRVRDRLRVGTHAAERVTGIEVSRAGGFVPADEVVSGEIASLAGLRSARVGDTFGTPAGNAGFRFPPAAFESVVQAGCREQQGVLFAALTELADQDPLIALRVGAAGEIAVSLYGEIQAEILGALLEDDYGVVATFQPATVVHAERVVGVGHAVEHMRSGDNPYLATVGLRVEPAATGRGIAFALEAERGSMPAAFFTAIEDSVRAALVQGRYGWPIHDCVVTITHTGYSPRQSHAHQPFNKAFSSVGADFRNLAPVVLFAALAQARTRVCEPINRIIVEVPADDIGNVLALIGRSGGTVIDSAAEGDYRRVDAELPAVRQRELAAQLPDLTHGHGVLTAEFARYRPVHGTPPRRPRSGPDPADRRAWFRAMPR